ncbi:putative disease resistance protein [Trifolium repens]|nr:putative disease resistance protein [Trifolium repens]
MTRIIQMLEDHVNQLQDARERIIHLVEEERANRNEIKRDVLNWLENVDELIERANQLIGECGRANVRGSTWGFPNLILRHQLNRNAMKIANDVIQLLRKGMFDRISYLPTLDGVASSSSSRGSEIYETRESLKDDILTALADLNSCNIGVYGLGGVGKTTLVEEVALTARRQKLFDKVVITHVSKNPDLKIIQGEIADLLGLRFEEETILGRAHRLRQRIKMEKSILVILDDIWTMLDLERVGIPFGNEHNGCKLLMTSRNQDVLLQMDVPKDFAFKLELMSEYETWNLFQFMAGDVVKDNNLKNVVIQVAKRCEGLPLRVVTIARAMRNKRDVQFWKDALRKLQSSDHLDISARTYSALELSYNSLESDEMRDSFLLFALMQGNDVEYFLKVAMGLEILKHVNTMDEARNKFYSIIRSLEATCLLHEVEVGGVIQMHDFVRDFAISIARRDKHVFLKRCTQFALSNYQNDELFPIIMQDNNVQYFPDDQLSILSHQQSSIAEEDDYRERLDILIRSNNHSLRDTTQEVDEQEVDGETRLSLWVDVAGGMSGGQHYNTAMSVNLRPSVCHPTQESSPPENEGIEMLRREVAAALAEAAAARAEAAAARAEAAAANERAAVSDQRIKFLENNMADFAQQMAALENQLSGGSCNTSRPRPTPQHSHYDDDLNDQPKDDLTCINVNEDDEEDNDLSTYEFQEDDNISIYEFQEKDVSGEDDVGDMNSNRTIQ